MSGYGYIPELTDLRDYSVKDVELPLKLTNSLEDSTMLPPIVDNRQYCSPTENQGTQGSCTSHSAVAMFEYLEKKVNNNYVNGSRAFVYYNSRLYAGLDVQQDTGSMIRSTIKAIVMDGIAEESKFPYDQRKWNVKPSEEIYRNALNFKATQYLRLDNQLSGVVDRIKSFVSTGYPVNFGFTVYESFYDITPQVPIAPYPSKSEKVLGGHAVIIVGYDDSAPSKNKRTGQITKGAALCQNSWGTNWGQKGFFYLPWDFFTSGLAQDVWSVTNVSWVDTKAFI